MAIFPRGDRALIADAIATCAGACLGTSTVTTYVESATGIEQGGRTGLTSVVTGLTLPSGYPSGAYCWNCSCGRHCAGTNNCRHTYDG